MAGNGTLRDPMEGLRDLCSAEIWGMEMSKVNEPPRRFEAGFFASEGYMAVDAMHHSGFEVATVGEHSKVKWFGPFARKYVTDKNHGCPFLTSSTMMEARPRAEKLVSIKHTHHLEALKIYEDDILISCSGTIGNVVLCTKDVDGWACSQDAIRVTVHEPDHLGPVYCFLQSPLGQFLLKKSQTGSVIRHIYEADVSFLPIPRLPRALREELTRLVKQASALRVEANRLLDEAEEMVSRQNYLEVDRIVDETSFVVSSGVLRHGNYKGSRRLDAYPFAVSAQQAKKLIERKRHAELRSLVSEVLYIGKVYRIPIDDERYGVPLLSGKDLVALRPSRDKLLATLNAPHIKRCQLDTGMILVSRSGSIGRVGLVRRNYESFIGSEDLLRIIPDETKLDGGYLVAFLGSSWGSSQLRALIYGSVILHLSKEQLASIMVPIPEDRGASIGDQVRACFDRRADARAAEDQALNLFMAAVKQGRKTIESEWGDQY